MNHRNKIKTFLIGMFVFSIVIGVTAFIVAKQYKADPNRIEVHVFHNNGESVDSPLYFTL